MTHIAVVLNPNSGSSDSGFFDSLHSQLRALQASYRVFPVEKNTDAAQDAVNSGADLLLACGGDGTVMAAVNAIARSARDVTLGIVPGGTANLLAAALKVPTNPKEAVQTALCGRERRIDLGRCGGTYFALGVGLGLTERLVAGASAQDKASLGKLAYAKAMLRELGARPHRFSFALDNGPEQRSHGVAVVVANAGEIGGGLKFAPTAEMNDGLLDLCILHRFGPRDLLRLAWHALTGRLPHDRAVTFLQAKSIEIRADPPLDAQLDGEVADLETPLRAQVLPGALRVRVPEED